MASPFQSIGLALGIGLPQEIANALGGGPVLTTIAAALDPVGALLGGQTGSSTPSTRAERKLAQIADGQMPYTYAYGAPALGWSRAWTGVGGSRTSFLGADGIIDDRKCDFSDPTQWSVKLNDDTFSIVTGAFTGSDLQLKLNTGQAIASDIPADWYVPNPACKYWRHDDAVKSGGGSSWHFAIRFFVADHASSNDTFMATIFGADYTDRDRWYLGKTGFHAVTRANSEIGTYGKMSLTFVIRGCATVYDWRTSGTGYSNNCALVLADQMKLRFGLSNSWFDSANMITEANACAETSWDPLGTASKYAVHDQFRDDESDIDVCQRLAAHMGGTFFERGDKIILAAGRARSSSLSLGPSDFVADDHELIPISETNWFNTIRPSYSPRFNEDGDPHGKMSEIKSVSVAAYVTEDGGDELEVDRAYDTDLGRRAKYLALRELRQLRLAVGSGGAAAYQGVFKMKAFPAELMDVITITNPSLYSGGVDWQVVDKILVLGQLDGRADLCSV